MFIATLFIIAPKEKQPKCPVKVKLCYINSMGYNSAMKRNKLDIPRNPCDSSVNYTDWKKLTPEVMYSTTSLL